jgi:predicted alpha/beta hydrolase
VVDEVEARTADGVTLRLDRVPAVGERKATVLCLHAMMTDGRYFGARRDDGFAAHLAARGLDVVVADFRGHGRSTPPTAGPDDWTFDDLVVRDLPALVDAAKPDAILGHSLGGLVACAGIATGAIAAPAKLLLAATSVWLGETPARRALMAAYRGVTVLFGKAPIRAIGAGTADESKSYVEQLTGWARANRWTSLSGIDYLIALEAIDVPTWAFVGAGDWMSRPSDAAGFSGRIRRSRPLRVVGRRHGDPMDPDHFQLFTRRELTRLWDEVVAEALPIAADVR